MGNWTFTTWFRKNKNINSVGSKVSSATSPMVFMNAQTAAPTSDRDKFINANGITFTVYPATGGHIVEFRSYDSTMDRLTTRLHVIPEGEEFAQRIAETVTLECLRGKQ
jgi:hypothetical protein